MKEIYVKTTVYDMGEGWRVDITEEIETYNAWIYYKDCGIKELMFGVGKDKIDFDSFCDMVTANYEEYQDSYKEEYCDK